jgi:hypothetical protein
VSTHRAGWLASTRRDRDALTLSVVEPTLPAASAARTTIA